MYRAPDCGYLRTPTIVHALATNCSVSFTATIGFRYVVEVYGNSDSDRGDFGLQIGSNGVCEYPRGPRVGSGSWRFSTDAMTPDRDGFACGPISSIGGDGWMPGAGPGSWFYVLGTVTLMQVSTCGTGTVNTIARTFFSVYDGACSDLQCISGNETSCRNHMSATFPSVEGELYRLRVHGVPSCGAPLVVNVSSLAA